ncbi:hypothetical protein TIFTF001_053045 [Ficus carica]|uniref:Uncharacterized protein n=1 Tax=Ficus carica TaxID=3494 RepID=A0AA88EEV6_FICCA|nr:hypothetical protein TIFTF001_053045 [Ficus carica]
MAAAVAAAI